MNAYPDKFTRKATITQKLRDEIAKLPVLLEKESTATYLEIGCDLCYTVMSLKDNFVSLTGIDIDEERVAGSLKTIDDARLDLTEQKKFNIILGTSKDIPLASYDVVLIDASHKYTDVKSDFENVIKLNTSKKYCIIFHDFGLVERDVKRFVTETFKTNEFHRCGTQHEWNPLGGPIDDWEAVFVILEKQ